MIAGLFLNPGFLFIAAALISVPIIIHLINRMRFKRIRWAAMEFLLKAQKRTRRRLIIEQLLLLALRCLLLALVGVLVSRFIGCGDTNLGGKPNLHIAIIDDTLSMTDAVKHDGSAKSAFDIAKEEFLIKKIAKGLSLSKTNDRLILLPLSKLDEVTADLPAFLKDNTYDHLNDKANLDKLTQDVNEMKPSMLHVKVLEGVKAAQKIMTGYPESRMTLHILSDFRQQDWAGKEGEGVNKELIAMAKGSKDLKIRVIDCVLPARAATGYPPSRDNVGIVDVRPETRIAGHRMPVRFAVKIKNYGGKQVETRLVVRNERTGKDMAEMDFSPQNPIKLSPGGETEVNFTWGDIRRGFFFQEEFKENESKFAHYSVRLTDNMQPLVTDAIQGDNVRHTFVEVRERVPILVIDGSSSAAENRRKAIDTSDSFVLGVMLQSVPGSSYTVVYGDEISAANPVAALERADLGKFPTIYLLNVRDLNAKQVENLENYVREGGGLGIYMGPNVLPALYNKTFYKDGKGLLPAPLKQTYPEVGAKELLPKPGDTFQILIRDDLFGNWPDGRSKTPIFGKMFDEPRQRDPLMNLPIRRYVKVDAPRWKKEPGRVHELATLPNEDDAANFGEEVQRIITEDAVKKAFANPALTKYRGLFDNLVADVREKARPGSEAKAYQLARQLDLLLTGKGNPDAQGNSLHMADFWNLAGVELKTMRDQLENVKSQVNFGDPFIVAQDYAKGKVVAVMSTAGKEWNDWSGGSLGSIIFPMFVWEMQKYLSSPGDDANLMVGTSFDAPPIDAEQFKLARLKMVRNFKKSVDGNYTDQPHGEQFGREDGSRIAFHLTKHYEPGLYISEVFDDSAADKKVIAKWAHAFNVDTEQEGQLARVSSDEMRKELYDQAPDAIKPVDISTSEAVLVPKLNDLSESPWLFLILLLVLVAEQALAVHLSFHLRNTDTDLAPAGAGPKV